MSQCLPKLRTIYSSESRRSEAQRQTGSLGSPNGANDHPSQFTDSAEEERILQLAASSVSNLKAFITRFIQLSCRPEHLAPLILDFYSWILSIVWSKREPGPDFLYPLSNLKKHKSERLARLLLAHSRNLQQPNLHVATSRMDGVDPPCVAVIDLNEVPREITEQGYTVSANFHGFVVLVLFLQILISLLLVIPASTDNTLPVNWLPTWLRYIYELIYIQMNFFSYISVVVVVVAGCGDSTLTLIRRSHISTPGCAVLLDRDFTVILVGPKNIVEAITESSFGISNPITRGTQPIAQQHAQPFWYETLEALCQGIPYVILAALSLLLLRRLPRAPMAYIPMQLVTNTILAIPYRVPLLRVMFRIPASMLHWQAPDGVFRSAHSRIVCLFMFTFLMAPLRDWAVGKEASFQDPFWHPKMWLAQFPFLSLVKMSSDSCGNCHIRTAKFLDIIGHPPVRRWEFDTLAAAATFQCLVVCRRIPRPIKNIDVLALLDTFVPDQTDVWKAWKERVADRIAHEVDISFAPTLPTFGDPKCQKDLKALLDQAQIGYGVFVDFYD